MLRLDAKSLVAIGNVCLLFLQAWPLFAHCCLHEIDVGWKVNEETKGSNSEHVVNMDVKIMLLLDFCSVEWYVAQPIAFYRKLLLKLFYSSCQDFLLNLVAISHQQQGRLIVRDCVNSTPSNNQQSLGGPAAAPLLSLDLDGSLIGRFLNRLHVGISMVHKFGEHPPISHLYFC